MSTNNRLMTGALLGVVIAAGGVGWWLWQGGSSRITALGVGEPLPAMSTARIDLLEEGKALAVTPTDVSGTGLGSGSVSIGEPVVAEVPRAPLTEVTGLKLGTTLALLTQAYANGGPMARSLANTAQDLVAKEGSRDLQVSIDNLRNATPHGGPVTVPLLLLESDRVASMGAPEGLPVSATTPAPQSWLVRQLSRFVTIKRGEDEPTADRWTHQMRLAQAQLARGNGNDAKLTLKASPLDDDGRLDILRELVGEYLDQQGKLTNAVNAYARDYLKQEAR